MIINPLSPINKNQTLIENFQKFNEDNFVRLTRQLNRQVTNNINARLINCGYTDLSTRHLSVFDHLDVEGTNIVTLASRAGITKQAMSKLVQETKTAGYVRVETSQKDSRAVIVHFSQKGLAFLSILESEINKIRQSIATINIITNEELTTMLSSLSKILSLLEKTDDIFNLSKRQN